MTLRTLVIVGVGLIGGSIALAARSRRVAQRIIGVGPDAETLERIRRQGIVDSWHPDLRAIAPEADAIVVCTPVDQIPAAAQMAVVHARPGTLVTDVGSVKAVLMRTLAKRLPPGSCFVGSHPLAGSDKSGPQAANVRLFENRLVILTPDPRFDSQAAARAGLFWESLGARVRVMDAETHDSIVAITSHLPHLLAAALAATLPNELRDFAASGFRDTTRIAAGLPSLWTAIMLQNREALVKALGDFDHALAPFRAALEHADRDAIDALLTNAKRNRDALGS